MSAAVYPPAKVDEKKYRENYDRIFGKKDKKGLEIESDLMKAWSDALEKGTGIIYVSENGDISYIEHESIRKTAEEFANDWDRYKRTGVKPWEE